VFFVRGLLIFNKNIMDKNKKDKIVMYTDKNGKVELRADTKNETLLATQNQIARIFGTTLQNVNLHLVNIYKDGELKKRPTIKESLIVRTEGGRSIQRPIALYNLDAIIAVGYRVNSKKATKFRIWATGILRDYLIKGFNLNQHKLVVSEKSLNDLHEAISFIESKSNEPLKAKISIRLTKDLI
jgi:hypothetical protein